VLHDGYAPPSPLRDVSANRSVDQLAPDNPLAAEMAQMRETLEDIRKTVAPRMVIPRSAKEDIAVLRRVVTENLRNSTPGASMILAGESSLTNSKGGHGTSVQSGNRRTEEMQ
jgi:hypothetical protein